MTHPRIFHGWPLAIAAFVASYAIVSVAIAYVFQIQTQATPVITVSPCSGTSCVTFVLSYANVTFPSGILAYDRIQATESGCLLIDSAGICVSKTPASWPGASVNMQEWTPTATSGTVARFTATAPVGSAVTFQLRGIAPARSYTILKDSAYYATSQSTDDGSMTFTWFVVSDGDPLFQVDFTPTGGGGGPGIGPIPTVTFTYTSPIRLFGPGPADGTVYFTAGQLQPGDPPYVYTWDFGDGQTSHDANPVHTYDVSLVGTFTVTLTVCSVSQPNLCATAQQQVTVVRWSLVLSLLILAALMALAIVLVRRMGRRYL